VPVKIDVAPEQGVDTIHVRPAPSAV
jgi:hypothetical protein